MYFLSSHHVAVKNLQVPAIALSLVLFKDTFWLLLRGGPSNTNYCHLTIQLVFLLDENILTSRKLLSQISSFVDPLVTLVLQSLAVKIGHCFQVNSSESQELSNGYLKDEDGVIVDGTPYTRAYSTTYPVPAPPPTGTPRRHRTASGGQRYRKRKLQRVS